MSIQLVKSTQAVTQHYGPFGGTVLFSESGKVVFYDSRLGVVSERHFGQPRERRPYSGSYLEHVALVSSAEIFLQSRILKSRSDMKLFIT